MMYTSFYHRTDAKQGKREGIVLLIVIAMLTLFAVVGLAFVFYAEAEAVSTSVTVQGQSKTLPDADPELLLSYALSQILYDTTNNYSAMRGLSMARTMYGSNQVGTTQFGQNYSAYSGVGRLHRTYGAADPAALNGFDDYYLPSYINYPTDGFIRDPEFYGYRNPLTTPQTAVNYRAGNAPYTYPDMNSLFLARVDADGSVVANSFWRSYLQPLAGNKYATPHPNGSYHNGLDNSTPPNPIAIGPFNPVDADAGGHVRNLDFSRGFKIVDPVTGAITYANNDSRWLDLGWPVMIAPNGKKYKALFAPLIVDLDNRINMWLAGNYNYTTKFSNKGYGVNEINPLILSPTTGQPLINNSVKNINGLTDWQNLLSMRYGATGMPPAVVPAQWPQRDGPVSFRIDFDGLNGGALALPNPSNKNYATAQYYIWPDFPNGTYGLVPPWFSPVGPAPATVPTELLNHPLAYNIFNPSPNNPLPPASNMEAILRYLGTGAPAVTSGFFKSMPNTFGVAGNPYAIQKNRGFFTSHSWTLDRISGAPYIPYNVATNANYSYNNAPAVSFPYPHPQMPALGSPGFAPGAANAPVVPGSEFTATFNSTLVNRLRVNLNRISSSQYDYPPPDGTGYMDFTKVIAPAPAWATSAPWTYANQFSYAQSARADNVNRVGLAYDIYNVLVMVTGAQDPNLLANAGMATTSPQFQAARWLAQLAVNIVDYIDSDDISTPFQWFVDPAGKLPPEYVFGTEQPRLVINEAYAQLDNNTTDPGITQGMVINPDPTTWTATTFNADVWVELHNPFKNTPAGETFPFDNGVARLQVAPAAAAAFSAYQIVLCQPDAVNMRAPGNNLGTPTAANVLATVTTWGTGGALTQVNAANGAFSDPTAAKNPALANNGFFVVGPQTTYLPGGVAIGLSGVNTPNPNPTLPVTYATPQMSVNLNLANVAQAAAITNLTATGTTILLQRLACPYLPPNPTVGTPTYNPYITIDYVQNVKTWDNRVANVTVNPAVLPGPVATFSAMGRKQPYYASRLVAQTPVPATTPQPSNTFFRHNADDPKLPAGDPTTFTVPFDWLVHLDRPVVNAMELMHVSGFHPHELTQQFIVYNAGPPATEAKFQHYAPWTDHAAMIFRALELLGVPSYLNGTTSGSRVPGKININTMNELEIFLALCDPQTLSSFTAADVSLMFTYLRTSRTPSGAPGATDAPFRSLATGWIPTLPLDLQYPQGAGLRDTLLRKITVGAVTQPLFQIPPPGSATQPPPPQTYWHPYQQNELLQKISNNVTTTSNIFAIWLTVGFFEVDDTFTPPKIGSEIGRDQGRQIRHRMFSIVDRSQMTLFNSNTTAKITGSGGPTGTPLILSTVMPITGATVNGGTWTLQAGMFLEFGTPGASEVVAVRTDTKGNLVGDFIGTWNAKTTPIVCRGNPGPWTIMNYNPRSDPLVVPHFTIIK